MCVCVFWTPKTFREREHMNRITLIYSLRFRRAITLKTTQKFRGFEHSHKHTGMKSNYCSTRNYVFSSLNELDVDGDIVHAIDMGGQGGQVLRDGTTFKACTLTSSQLSSSSDSSKHACSGESSVKVHATSLESSWADTAGLTDDDAMNDVMKSYLGVAYPSDLIIEVEDLKPGAEYHLSLYYVEYGSVRVCSSVPTHSVFLHT